MNEHFWPVEPNHLMAVCAEMVSDEPVSVLVEADSQWSKQTEPLVFTLTSGASLQSG